MPTVLSGNRVFLAIIAVAIAAGVSTGYILAAGNKSAKITSPSGETVTTAKSAAQDNQTFRDFAEGTIQKKQPTNGDEYTEGTHTLVRDGAQPVALTSSVVDLSQYEGKRVKVYGETQKAIKEGWLMDVGKVELR